MGDADAAANCDGKSQNCEDYDLNRLPEHFWPPRSAPGLVNGAGLARQSMPPPRRVRFIA
jgi:hypothetical protein